MHPRLEVIGALLLCAVNTLAAERRLALISTLDPEGMPLVAVDADDYVIEEGATRGEVLHVSPADYPVAVIIDTSSFARDDFPKMRSAVLRFLGALSPRDVVLYTSGTPARRVVDFGQNVRQIEEAVRHTFAEPNAGPRRIDAIIDASHHLTTRHAALTRIVVVSAGGPDASARSAGDVLNAVLASRSIADVIDLRQGIASNNRGVVGAYDPRAPMPRLRRDSDADVLVNLSRRTLGSYERIITAAGYDHALNQVRNRLLSEAIVEYAVAPEAPHDLHVGVRLPGAVVRGIALDSSR